jgi:tRNA 2-thiocytidine biosynthesis protein TtcA
LCGSQENLQRRQIGEMLKDWARKEPGRIQSITRALTDIVPSHLLDHRLFDFVGLKPGLKPSDGDAIKEPLFAEL